MICLDHWTSHVLNCAICLSDSLTVSRVPSRFGKDVKMFILQTYANEEKRSQDMYWKWITRYFIFGDWSLFIVGVTLSRIN